jgi:hypothetical protein
MLKTDGISKKDRSPATTTFPVSCPDEPFGQGSPQTSMKGVDIPVAGASNESKAEGPAYNRGG